MCIRDRVNSPRLKYSSFITALWKGMLVVTPTMIYSYKARFIRAMASFLSLPQTVSFEVRGSLDGVMVNPVCTPLSTRTPGPPEERYLRNFPGEGVKLLSGSSAFSRHSIAQPLCWISDCL